MLRCFIFSFVILIGSLQSFSQKINETYSKAVRLQSIMDQYAGYGIPGIAMAVHTSEGYWAGAAGYARLEDSTRMNNQHLQYTQSVAKSYMAVAIMQLKEMGKIKLDTAITAYLPKKYSDLLPYAKNITVRMLLTHTSGIPDYATHPSFVSYVILNPQKEYDLMVPFKCIQGVPLLFNPGSNYSYSNINYLILALIGDALTGDHAVFISKHILEPLQLAHTFYRNNIGFLKKKEVVDSYWDVLDSGKPANISAMQKTNVVSMIGDDGMVATPLEASYFSEGPNGREACFINLTC